MGEEEKEQEIQKVPIKDTEKGHKSKGIQILDDVNEARKGLEQVRDEARKEKEELQDLLARQAFSGGSDGIRVEAKPKVISDREYADMLERGEVNPLAEDGFR